MAAEDDRQDGSLEWVCDDWSDFEHGPMDPPDELDGADSLLQITGSPLPLMTSSGSDSATQGRLGQDVLHAPACTEAGIDREVGLDLNNVCRLGTGFAGHPEVLQQVFALHCSYMRHLEHPNAVPTEGPAAFPHCPIFAKPPGYKHQLALLLEEEAAKFDPPSFAMRPAACIVDESRGADPHRAEGDRVSFEGQSTCYPDTGQGCDKGLGEDGNLFVTRKGGDKIPPDKTIKLWKFQIVRGEDKTPLDNSIYVCIFVPYRPHLSRTPISKTACAEDHVDEETAAMIENFVVAVATEHQRRGMLTGEGQAQRYRKDLMKAIKTVCKRFIGPKSDPKWADNVFRPDYKQKTLEQVFEFIDRYGHLPWIRSEAVVQESGIDLEKDHVNLLEAVENLFLYLRRSNDEKKDSDEEDQPPNGMPAQWNTLDRREFLTRVLLYSNLPLNIIARQNSSELDKREAEVIAQEIVTRLPRGKEEKDPQEDARSIAGFLSGKLSKVEALDIATEAARRKNEGETIRTACGKPHTS
jgi:hypothetical protein